MLSLLNGKGKENIPTADCDSDCRHVMSANDYIASLRDANTPLGAHPTGLCSSYPECYLRFVQLALKMKEKRN